MAKLHELKKGIEKHKESQTSQYAVDGEKPSRLPLPGETVLITWADPNVIGSPKLTLGMLVFSTTQAISSFGIVLVSGIFTAFLLAPLAMPSNKENLP